MAELCKEDQVKLKAYETLNFWNNHDANLAALFTKWCVILPAVTMLYVAYPGGPPWIVKCVVIVLSIVIMFILKHLYQKFDLVIRERYRLLHEIECDLKFRAHLDVYDYARQTGLIGQYMKWRLRVTVGGIVLLFITLGISIFCAFNSIFTEICKLCENVR